MCENNQQYKIIVAYDGTDYAGWQVQKNQKSVANVIENRFFDVFKKKIRLLAASRTDAGVHAFGQVACFTTDLTIDSQKLKRALNKSLPASIVIRDLEPVGSSFHPRYCVTQKTYWYHFFPQQPLPWVERYGYFQNSILDFDLELLKEALQVFVGTHDFRSFCSGYDIKNTIRTIDSISLDFNEEWNAYKIVFKGKGFLRYMIRRIVGASFQVSQKKLKINELQDILNQKDPNQRIITAPAQGLILHEILYKQPPN